MVTPNPADGRLRAGDRCSVARRLEEGDGAGMGGRKGRGAWGGGRGEEAEQGRRDEREGEQPASHGMGAPSAPGGCADCPRSGRSRGGLYDQLIARMDTAMLLMCKPGTWRSRLPRGVGSATGDGGHE